MATKEKQEEIQQAYDPMKDMVTVTLPRATGNEQNFKIVNLNGKVWKIMKGASVQIPRPVYEVLAESWRMEGRLQAFNEAQASRAIPG